MVRDEDTFSFPPEWYGHRHPRRTSAGVVPLVPDRSARATVARQIDARANRLRSVLGSPTTPEAVRAAGVAWSDGRSGAPAVGAAAVLAVLVEDDPRTRELLACVDVWLVEGGPAYAAEAAVHLMSMVLVGDFPGPDRYTADRGVRHLRPAERGEDRSYGLAQQVALRVRWALATVDADEHTAVVAGLEQFRSGHPYARVATSVLAPERHDWVGQDVADAVAGGDAYRAKILTAAVHTVEQAAAVCGPARVAVAHGSLALLTTMIDGVGPAVGPVLLNCAGDNPPRQLVGVVARLPGDEVMRELIERAEAPGVAAALTAAAARFPVRAMRLLGKAAARPAVAELLRVHAQSHPELVGGRPSGMPAATVAPAHAVPAPLVDPPWLTRPRPPEPIVISGLTCDDEPTVDWLPGERVRWLSAVGDPHPDTRWDRVADRVLGRGRFPYRLFGHAPGRVARRVLQGWDPATCLDPPRRPDRFLRVAVARFGVDALDMVLRLADTTPAGAGAAVRLLQPLASPPVARQMAAWFRKAFVGDVGVRADAEAWLLRHPLAAARALVPAALDRPGAERAEAENALRHLYAHGHGDAVRRGAAGHGRAAAAAIDGMPAADPRVYQPVHVPQVPAWASPEVLPPVRLRNGGGLLPASAVAHLVTMLALSTPAEPYPGMAAVTAACTPDSLAAFGWSLFQQSLLHRDASSHWTIGALGVVGDDDTVRRLTPILLGWPDERGRQTALQGVAALAAIGSGVAVRHLDRIARQSAIRAVRDAAGQRRDELRGRG
jgi:hypothetical protein